MSANEQIGRLQLLLERVQSRAAGARGNGAAHAAPVAAAAAPAYVAPAYVEEEAAISASPETPAQAHASVNPAAYPSDVPPAAEVAEAYDEYGDVEVSSEVVEVDIDVEEGEPMESGAQPVAAQQTMPPEEIEEAEEHQPLTTQQPAAHASMHEPEEVTQTAPANEIEEPAPSSSRRPIAGEEPVVAYEEESAPRHTPPPESGKQVAAAPSNRPPSGRPSVPPPSLEGHTLIGGWREPGLGGPQIGVPGTTGVRVPPPPRAHEPAPVVQAQASGTRLSPDVTQPQLGASANVASFVGAPPVARPTTLGELLDLTLSL